MSDDDNVIRLFPQSSDLYFPVVERLDGWQDKFGDWHVDPSQKKLVRVDEHGKLVALATVGRGYKTVLNRDLFPYVEERMVERMGADLVRGVRVTEDTSYNGRDCYRHYVFPSMRCDVIGGGDVAFRLIIGNSYGARTVQLISGAIDFFCTNGMVSGVHEKVARKHTSGLTLTGIDEWISDSVTYFVKNAERLDHWSRVYIEPRYGEPLFKHLVSKNLVSDRNASELHDNMLAERVRRTGGTDQNPTLWHLYSALTTWATHGDVRKTINDHAATTRIERGKHVNRVIDAAERFLSQRRAA